MGSSSHLVGQGGLVRAGPAGPARPGIGHLRRARVRRLATSASLVTAPRSNASSGAPQGHVNITSSHACRVYALIAEIMIVRWISPGPWSIVGRNQAI